MPLQPLDKNLWLQGACILINFNHIKLAEVVAAEYRMGLYTRQQGQLA